jgi:Domain of unknown function (DUF4281)
MTPQFFFLLLTVIGGIGWFSVIALSPFWKHTDRFVIGIIVALIAICYTYLNFGYIGEVGGPMAFMSYDGVMKIFANPYLVDGGWAHILAFDLMVAMWIKHNAARLGIDYWVVVLVLLISIPFAPLGLFIYLMIRWLKSKQYFQGF